MDKQIWRRPQATANTDPAEYSWSISRSRWRSLGYALSGIVYMLRFQKNTRIMSAASGVVIVIGWWAGLDSLRWAVLVLAVALVWIAEFINAAIEAAADISSSGFHPMARVAKDVAAGAVLLASTAALLVGALILAPPLMEAMKTG